MPVQTKGSCTCRCNACDGGHHCNNPPNCNARK
jgi:hypothetical protein